MVLMRIVVKWTDEYVDECEQDDGEINGEKFSRILRPVSWSDTKVFCVLDFVTSSQMKRAEGAAIKDPLNQDNRDSNGFPTETIKSVQKKHGRCGCLWDCCFCCNLRPFQG